MFTPSQIAPPAFGDPWVDKAGLPTTEIYNWFLITLLPAIQQAPSLSGNTGNPTYEATGQTASIAATDLSLGSLSTGLYRVTVYIRVSTPAGVSSSITPILSFTDDGVACTVTGTAHTSNAINTPSSQSFLVAVDQPGPIQISTTYASNPAGAAVYQIAAVAERV